MRRVWLLLIPLLLFLVVDQILLRTVLSDDVVAGRRIAPFHPPVFSPMQEMLARALRDTGQLPPTIIRFDAELGWATRESFTTDGAAYDARGARIGVAPVPATRTQGVRRIATFGCSYTHGDEVGNVDAWAAVLDAMRPDLEVENFGVGGFGLDQALLRYRRLAREIDVDEVWLGLMPRAALRVVSMYRPAHVHDDLSIGMKPRFELNDDGSLRLVPMPVASLTELGTFILAPDDRFVRTLAAHDAFVGKLPAAYAPKGSSLWHASFAARLCLTKLEARGRSNEDALRDETSECFRLLRAIVRDFRKDVEARGDRFRLLVMPDRPSLDQWKAAQTSGETVAYQTLVDALRTDGVEVVDVVDALAAEDVPGAGLFAERGHWTAKGNRIVAGRLTTLVD